jgi:nitrogen fixation NifU-like protein
MADGDFELQDLYRDVLIDYYRDATYKGEIQNPDLSAHGANPTCGDEIKLTVRKEGDVIKEVRFSGCGCVISQASSTMMCEAVEGKTVDHARELIAAFRKMMIENGPVSELPEDIGETEALEGVRKFPIRVKCAILAWITFRQGLDENLKGRASAQYTEVS